MTSAGLPALPSEIDPRAATLPASYENARAALTECSRVDECQEWANKAGAIASYAHMANDRSLEIMANRIKARAIRRCGELLKAYNSPGARTDIQPRGGTPPRSASEAAAQAGMSPDQHKQAVRVANIPEKEFDDVVESEAPPSLIQLAQHGRKPLTDDERREAKAALVTLERFAAFCGAHDPAIVAAAVPEGGKKPAETRVKAIDGWLDRFAVALLGAPTATSRKHPLPIETLPDEWRGYCVEHRSDLDPDATWRNFRDHWKGSGGKKADWAATWRLWVRREKGSSQQKVDFSYLDKRQQ